MFKFYNTSIALIVALIFSVCDVTAQNKCLTPENLKAVKAGSSFAKISWSKVKGSCGYKLRARVVGTSVWSSMRVLPSDSITKISNLAPNSTYELQILSYCNIDFKDTSEYSVKVNFTTEFPCETPFNLKVDSITSTSVLLHWTGPLNSTKYIIRYKTQNERPKWVMVSVGEGNGNYFLLSNLNPETKYIWTVASKCDGSSKDNSLYAEPLGVFTTLKN